MSNTVLMTGFPGFIAERLVRRILDEGDDDTKFYFIVLAVEIFRAKAACVALESAVPSFAGRWRIVEGDVTKPDLGIPAKARQAIVAEVTHVWHLAAIYDLAVSEALAHRVNVDGTRHVLDLCERIEHLDRLLYISTCYVAGVRAGTIYEDELAVGQPFRNHYESTKHRAEEEVQRRWSKIPAVIFRPSIVVGDSRDGSTVKGDGPYQFIRFLLRLPRWLPVPQLAPNPATTVNIVPVDFVTNAMVAIAKNDGAAGKVFQLADPQPMTVRDLMTHICARMDRARPRGKLPWRVTKRIRGALGMPPELIDYLEIPTTYDVTNTARFLEGTGVRCPRVAECLDNMITFTAANRQIFAANGRCFTGASA